MVSSHRSKEPDPCKAKNSKKPSNGEAPRHSPSPPPPNKKVPSFEFEHHKVPRGHRTDREKKKLRHDADSGALSNHGHPRPLKRLRTGRSSRPEKVRSKDDDELGTSSAPPQVVDDKVTVKQGKQGQGNVEEGGKVQRVESEVDQQFNKPEEQMPENDAKVSSPQAEDTTIVQNEQVEDHLGNEQTPADAANTCTGVEEAGQLVIPGNIQQKVEHSAGVEEMQERKEPVEEMQEHKEPMNEPDTSLSLGLSGSHHRTVSKRAKSFQTISNADTFSRAVTTSLSLSCSHPFTHNPSCSLTQTSHDNNQEFSSASQPVSHSRGGRKMDFGEYPPAQRAFSESHQLPQQSRPKGSMHRKQLRSTGSWEPWSDREKARADIRVTVREIVSQPVSSVGRRMRQLPSNVLEELKTTAKDLLERSDKRDEFLELQAILQGRSDISSDALLHDSHRTQLQILVALKTGIQAFLQQEMQLKPLSEILANTRCPNVQCLSQLPVDNCECRICTQKGGFCNACMCVVCSKFDFENNTCAWVGCDYCIHWCHTDCGLRKSCIKVGTSGMQFHCVCGHTSELFGFVKEVFTSCAKEWSRAVLCKELDCVKRMFQGSEDLRGKHLCLKAGQLLLKLENNSDVAEACNSMLRFFEESSISVALAEENQTTMLERATLALQTYDRVLEEKRTDAAEMQYERARKKAEIEELESIVRIKQAEAKMFQARADEAAREADGLQRIVLAKCLKVEEEYAAKISKLQLLEAEEKRKRKFDDLQLLERGSYNFDIVRKLMCDLQDLLANMEATKRLKAEGTEKYLQRYLQPR